MDWLSNITRVNPYSSVMHSPLGDINLNKSMVRQPNMFSASMYGVPLQAQMWDPGISTSRGMTQINKPFNTSGPSMGIDLNALMTFLQLLQQKPSSSQQVSSKQNADVLPQKTMTTASTPMSTNLPFLPTGGMDTMKQAIMKQTSPISLLNIYASLYPTYR